MREEGHIGEVEKNTIETKARKNMPMISHPRCFGRIVIMTTVAL